MAIDTCITACYDTTILCVVQVRHTTGSKSLEVSTANNGSTKGILASSAVIGARGGRSEDYLGVIGRFDSILQVNTQKLAFNTDYIPFISRYYIYAWRKKKKAAPVIVVYKYQRDANVSKL